jgi:hypothetical protein
MIVRHQVIVVRMLYFPWAGVTLALAVVLESLTRRLGRYREWLGGVIVSIVMALYATGIVMFAGFACVYRLRAEHDQRQMTAFLRAVPSLPGDREIVLLPMHLDEHSVRYATGSDSPLDRYLEGAFERVWSAENIARMAYRRPDISAITASHWEEFHFTAVHRAPNSDDSELVVNRRRVPISQLLAFTYADERVVLLSPLVLSGPTGGEISLPLPLVERVRTSESPVKEVRITLEPLAGGSQ